MLCWWKGVGGMGGRREGPPSLTQAPVYVRTYINTHKHTIIIIIIITDNKATLNNNTTTTTATATT